MIKINIFKHLLLLLSGLFFICCSKEKVPQPEQIAMGYEYFPLEKGNFWVYQVDSIVYNDFTQTTDTFSFQLKEMVESDYLDNENRITHRIERYKRADSISPWKLTNVCSICKTSNRVEKTENNVKIIKLVFPVKEGIKWNGNAFNYKETWNYQYQETNKPFILSQVSFDSTLCVLQKDEFNLIESQYYAEKYAKNVGLIYIKNEDLKTEINGKISSGLKYTQTLLNFGTSK
jgi:hypothetical protein